MPERQLYIVITGKSLSGLETAVTDAIHRGYTPQGGVEILSWGGPRGLIDMYQAMVYTGIVAGE